MGIAHRIADAMFDAAVGALDGVDVIGHGFAGVFVDQLKLVAEVNRHWHQPTKRSCDHRVADDDCA